MDLIDNFKQDLIKSLKKTLLIELNKNDINQFGNDGFNMAILYSQYIYDQFINNSKSTNLIYIDADKYEINNSKDKEIIFFKEIINLTLQKMQTQKNIDIIKAGIKGAFSYFTEPLIRNIIDDYIDTGIDQISNLLSDSIKDIIKSIAKELNYNFTNEVLNNITNKVNETSNTSTSSILEKLFSKKLNLSQEAIKKLNNLSYQFKKDFTPIKIFSLVIELLISIAINDEEKESTNKLIFINNPHKLDENSLAVLSFLFSFAKDLKENDKHIGISVIYCYSDDNFQPYQDLKDNKYKISKKLLDEQRRFTQRYTMLERPSSDIPNIAVKSSTFVGRENELQILKNQFENFKDGKNIQIIRAEPGIGKTKLIKKHIEQIKFEKNGNKIIQLTILNQVGHCSTNTGLTSLKNSILKEAERLEALKVFEEIAVDKIKDIVKSNVISYIEDLIGVNNIIEIGTSIKDAYNLKKDTNIVLEQSIKDINAKDKKIKEQQFEDIIKAILELRTIAYEGKAFKPFPIIFFIDDIQWIDEESSEFILKYLTKYESIDIYIMATQRLSDATTELELAKGNVSLNSYKISLLQQIGIHTDKTIEEPEGVNKLTVLKPIDLNGVDEENLTELISITIDPENKTEDKKQKDTSLAQFIIKNLVNKSSGSKKYVNTLFAIETINLLCDENLYNSKDEDDNEIFKSIDYLILQNPLRYNDKSIENFTKILDDTIEVLNKKYIEAFEHINSDKKFEQQFNLMSYSIFEERLHILKQYFKEYGDAAVNTLLFSSLLGAPFNSEIVKNILKTLSITKEPLLSPLKEYVKKSNQCNLERNHYEIIEEVYEILSRYLLIQNAYSYNHNLLEIFLDRQLDYLINRITKEYNRSLCEKLRIDINDIKNTLYEFIFKEINFIKKEEEFFNKEELKLNINNYESMLFFRISTTNMLKKAFKLDEKKWARDYTISLSNLAISYKNINQFKKAIILEEDCIEILKNLYEKEKVIWTKDYIISLINLAFSYRKNNQLEKSIQVNISALNIVKDLFYNKQIYLEEYIFVLNNLAISYNEHNQTLDALKFQKVAEEILIEQYNQKPDFWVDSYVFCLNNLALFYNENYQIDNAIKKLELAIKIIQHHNLSYENNISYFSNLSSLYETNNEIDKSIKIGLKVLNIAKKSYNNNKLIGVKQYIVSLNNLGSSYSKNNQNNEALSLFEESLKIVKNLYLNEPSVWIEDFITTCNNLILISFKSKKEVKSILINEILKRIEEKHLENQNRWSKDYIMILNNFAYLYYNNKQIDKAIELQKKCVQITRIFDNNMNKLGIFFHLELLTSLQKYFEEKIFETNQIILDEYGTITMILVILQKNMLTRNENYISYYKDISDRFFLLEEKLNNILK